MTVEILSFNLVGLWSLLPTYFKPSSKPELVLKAEKLLFEIYNEKEKPRLEMNLGGL